MQIDTANRPLLASLAMAFGEFAYKWGGRIAWVIGLGLVLEAVRIFSISGDLQHRLTVAYPLGVVSLIVLWSAKYYSQRLYAWGYNQRR
jgi:hypothetical protein